MHHSISIQRIAFLAVLIAVFAASAAWAGPRDHMEGFFMRLSAGGGAAESELESGGNTGKISGEGGDLNFAIGGIVSPNLALHGTLWGWSLTDPDVTLAGPWGSVSGQANADFSLGAVGVGLTYYFMPANFYLSGSVGVGALSLDAGGVTFDSDAGGVIDITLGKEWWVGNRWGLGVAAGLNYHSIPDGGVDANWKGPGFGIRFSATYN
jgi:hypothetical protein